MERKTKQTKRNKVPEFSAADLIPNSSEAKDILHQRANYYAQKKPESQASSNFVSYICFKLGDKEYYGIPYQYTKEIINNITITKVPHTPDYIAGVINRHSSLVTIIDLSNLFHIEHAESKNTSIIILQHQHLTIGIIVDEIESSANYSPDNLDQPIVSDGILKIEYILGIHDGHITILNIIAMLSDPEITLKKSNMRVKE